MPLDDLPELTEARADIGRAIKRFVDLRNEKLNLYPEQEEPVEMLYVSGWAISLYYTNTEMERDAAAAGFVIVPDDQAFPTSLGLFTLGARWF